MTTPGNPVPPTGGAAPQPQPQPPYVQPYAQPQGYAQPHPYAQPVPPPAPSPLNGASVYVLTLLIVGAVLFLVSLIGILASDYGKFYSLCATLFAPTGAFALVGGVILLALESGKKK
jgi:hypothetical protein